MSRRAAKVVRARDICRLDNVIRARTRDSACATPVAAVVRVLNVIGDRSRRARAIVRSRQNRVLERDGCDCARQGRPALRRNPVIT